MEQLQKNNPLLLPLNERRALDISESTCAKLNGHYPVGLLRTEGKPHLPNNRNLAISRMKSIENKLKRDLTLTSKQRNHQRLYRQRHAKKLTPEEVSNIKPFTNYVPHHAVSNVNKPNKIRVVFNAAAEYQNSSLNKHLLKGPDLLNKLITIFLCY